MTTPYAEAKKIVDDLMARAQRGEIDRIGIGEIREAIAESESAPMQGLSTDAFEEVVTRELVRRV